LKEKVGKKNFNIASKAESIQSFCPVTKGLL
jgi:hypothetical protein